MEFIRILRIFLRKKLKGNLILFNLIFVSICFYPCYDKEIKLIKHYKQCQFSCQEINDLINCYKRPITFLAITNDCNDIISLAQQNPDSVFVFLNAEEISSKLELPSNFIHLSKDCNIEDLEHLSEAEHFDVVFVKKHINKLNYAYAETLYNLGENVFVYIKKEDSPIIPHLLSLEFKQIKNLSATNLLFCALHSIKFLKRTHWLQEASDENSVRNILSSLDKKILYKNYGIMPTSSVWLPGINLMTFKMLNGRIPSFDHLKNEIIRLFDIPHVDWMPNNMIVQGNNLSLIDFEDPNGIEPRTVHTKRMLDLVILFVTEHDYKKIPVRFEAVMRYCQQKLHPKKGSIIFFDRCWMC